jgi:16S rRNA (adenine1518-N6/adenine1519-N6)-dimethyltransferase
MSLPKADKNFGQHFLQSEKIISAIVNDFSPTPTAIVEVGPGPGILTEKLYGHNIPMLVIEKDLRFRELLAEIIPPERTLFQDALTVNFSQTLNQYFTQEEQQNIWLVSNLPYNVSAPLTLLFLQVPAIKQMTLMYQKEVGEKILGTTINNSLHMLCNNFFTFNQLCKVPPGAFSPPPKVDSIVLSAKRVSTPKISLDRYCEFEKFLRNIFKMRRKQLGKVLRQSYAAQHIENIEKQLNIPLTIRAEKLSPQQIYDIFHVVITR